MSDRKNPTLPFESSDPTEAKLWQALGQLPRAEPPASLRKTFYDQLEKAGARGRGSRIRGWLGFSNNAGWATAAACLLVGFALARIGTVPDTSESDRLAALEHNIALLNRELVLDRLQDDAPGKRLLGVHDASGLVQHDDVIAQALLVRASEDSSPSVRSAAIAALGSQLHSAKVADELMGLLENAESPIVQLALTDLVLRNGNRQQLDRLRRLADEGRLYPDLVTHVRKSLGNESI